jgi:hypothetical protein
MSQTELGTPPTAPFLRAPNGKQDWSSRGGPIPSGVSAPRTCSLWVPGAAGLCTGDWLAFPTLKQGPLTAARSTCSDWDEVPPVSCMVDRANRNKSQVIVDTVTEHLEPQEATETMPEDERQPFHMAHDERPDSRVVQIIPANPGSWAELQDPGGEPIRLPLACWALVEEDNGRGEWNVRYVVGMIGGAGDAVRLEAANSRPNFRGYRFDS